MFKNKKIITIGAVTLLLCWIGNIIYYNSKVLNEPLFLKHYYEIPKEVYGFNLYYVQNINSTDKIVRIGFPELGEDLVAFSESDSNLDNRYYVVKSVQINIANTELGGEKYNNKLITRADIQFSSGKQIKVNLGKIYINCNQSDNSSMESKGIYFNGDNTASFSFNINKDIKVTEISSEFFKNLNNLVQFSSNKKVLSKSSFPIQLKAPINVYPENWFTLDCKMNTENENNQYYFHFDILTEDEHGNKGSTSCYIGSFVQPPFNIDVDALKKSAEEGK